MTELPLTGAASKAQWNNIMFTVNGANTTAIRAVLLSTSNTRQIAKLTPSSGIIYPVLIIADINAHASGVYISAVGGGNTPRVPRIGSINSMPSNTFAIIESAFIVNRREGSITRKYTSRVCNLQIRMWYHYIILVHITL